MSYKRRSVSLRILIGDSDKARFWAKVSKGAPGECWLWTAGTWHHGYGQFTLTGTGSQPKQIHVGAHVLSYFLATGVDPVGQFVCHSCDNPPCVNPAHLFLGDHRINNRDAASKGRFSVPRPRSHKIPAEDIPGIRHEIAIGPRGTAARIARERGVTEAHISQLVHGTARQYDAPLQPRLIRKAS